MIAAWSVDRLGRSLQHLVGLLQELQALKCDLYLHQQAIDTSTPPPAAPCSKCAASLPSSSGLDSKYMGQLFLRIGSSCGGA